MNVYIFVFGIFFGIISWSAPDLATKYLTKRTVEIEWDEIPDATQYDLEIYDGKNKKFIKSFSSKTSTFKLNVKMGRYFFRSRIFDKFERSSEWTDMAELLIAPPPTKIKNTLPKEPEVFANKLTGLFELPISWESVPGIEEYKVILETPEGVVEKEFTMKGTNALLKIPPGQYQVRLRAVLADGTVGDPSEPTTPLSVLGAKIQPPSLQFKRKDKNKEPYLIMRSELTTALIDGDLFYKALEGTEWKKVREIRDFPKRKIVIDSSFTPGMYQIKAHAKAKGFTPSESNEIIFIVKPLEAALASVNGPEGTSETEEPSESTNPTKRNTKE